MMIREWIMEREKCWVIEKVMIRCLAHLTNENTISN